MKEAEAVVLLSVLIKVVVSILKKVKGLNGELEMNLENIEVGLEIEEVNILRGIDVEHMDISLDM